MHTDIAIIPKSSLIITVFCIFKEKNKEYEEFNMDFNIPNIAKTCKTGVIDSQLGPRKINITGLAYKNTMIPKTTDAKRINFIDE